MPIKSYLFFKDKDKQYDLEISFNDMKFLYSLLQLFDIFEGAPFSKLQYISQQTQLPEGRIRQLLHVFHNARLINVIDERIYLDFRVAYALKEFATDAEEQVAVIKDFMETLTECSSAHFISTRFEEYVSKTNFSYPPDFIKSVLAIKSISSGNLEQESALQDEALKEAFTKMLSESKYQVGYISA